VIIFSLTFSILMIRLFLKGDLFMSFQGDAARENQAYWVIKELITPTISRHEDNLVVVSVLTEVGRKIVHSLDVVPGWARAWLEDHPELSEPSSVAATIGDKEVVITEGSSAEDEETPRRMFEEEELDPFKDVKKTVLGPDEL